MKQKTSLLIILMAVTCSLWAQSTLHAPGIISGTLPTWPLHSATEQPCGTFVKEPPEISEWDFFDTLGNLTHAQLLDIVLDRIGNNKTPEWVYSTEQRVSTPFSLAWELGDIRVSTPCDDLHDPEIYEQYRIDRATGVRQRRTRSISYKYLPPALSDYEKLRDSLYAENLKNNSHTTQWGPGMILYHVDTASVPTFSSLNLSYLWFDKPHTKHKKKKSPAKKPNPVDAHGAAL